LNWKWGVGDMECWASEYGIGSAELGIGIAARGRAACKAASKRPVFQLIPGYSGLFLVKFDPGGEGAELPRPKSKIQVPKWGRRLARRASPTFGPLAVRLGPHKSAWDRINFCTQSLHPIPMRNSECGVRSTGGQGLHPLVKMGNSQKQTKGTKRRGRGRGRGRGGRLARRASPTAREALLRAPDRDVWASTKQCPP